MICLNKVFNLTYAIFWSANIGTWKMQSVGIRMWDPAEWEMVWNEFESKQSYDCVLGLSREVNH